MKILVLGGTQFVGRHIVEAALARGHHVTLFNRGLTNPHLFPELEKLRGDRSGDLSALESGAWDAVIDTSGDLPRQVWDSVAMLAERVEHYTVLSTILVYANLAVPGIDEGHPVMMPPSGDDVDEFTVPSFGALKALGERAALYHMPGRVLSVRTGLPVGPYDFTDRFSYWPLRVAQGGEVLAPGAPDRPVQYIDARDLAGWMVRMAEERTVGVYNASGPQNVLTFGKLLDACHAIAGGGATFTWIPDDFLLERNLMPLYDLPIWVPPEELGVYMIDNRKALDAGLTFRPLTETIRAILGDGPPFPKNGRSDLDGATGIDSRNEQELLRAWHQD